MAASKIRSSLLSAGPGSIKGQRDCRESRVSSTMPCSVALPLVYAVGAVRGAVTVSINASTSHGLDIMIKNRSIYK